MGINSKLKFKKPHMLWLKKYKTVQSSFICQKKTFDHLFLKSYTATSIKAKEYEALRRILSRKLSRLLRFSLKVRPYIFVTAKPKEMRMGKGKGSYSYTTFLTTCRNPFVKVSWCHKQYLPHFLYALQTATKKGALRCRF